MNGQVVKIGVAKLGKQIWAIIGNALLFALLRPPPALPASASPALLRLGPVLLTLIFVDYET